MTKETLDKAIALNNTLRCINDVLYDIKAGEKLMINGKDMKLCREDIRKVLTDAKARLEAELERM